MSDIEALGNELREARQLRDLTLQQVERATHIRTKFLEALELGQPALLPSPVQARGFLRNYARYLGLDGDLIVARWDEALHGGKRRRGRRGTQPLSFDPSVAGGAASRAPQLPSATLYSSAYTAQQMHTGGIAQESAPKRRRLRLSSLFLGALLMAVIIGLFAVGVQWIQSRAEAGAAVLSPIPTNQTVSTPTITMTPTPLRPTLLPNPNAQAQQSSDELIMQITIVARTWLRVTVDGTVSYQGAPGPNTLLQYRGKEINIRAGNAAGVRLLINDRDLGILGARGQTFDQTFTTASLNQQ